MNLKGRNELERSAVVANSAMNRERELAGTNSYSRDLNLDVLGFLIERIRSRGQVAWLDLCCGSGRALVQASERLTAAGFGGRFEIVGVDLVCSFWPAPSELRGLRLLEANLETWAPSGRYDLVTCVHGLHYVGDKLGLIARAASWLEDEGRLVAHLDLANVRLEGGQRASRRLLSVFRAARVSYEPRRRLVRVDGPRALALPFAYLGADDAAGPNFTGQPAVTSVYRPL